MNYQALSVFNAPYQMFILFILITIFIVIYLHLFNRLKRKREDLFRDIEQKIAEQEKLYSEIEKSIKKDLKQMYGKLVLFMQDVKANDEYKSIKLYVESYNNYKNDIVKKYGNLREQILQEINKASEQAKTNHRLTNDIINPRLCT
jgi:hypothetical protein